MLWLTTLALGSVPIPEGSIAQSHTLVWTSVGDRWLHDHENNCGPNPAPYFDNGNPPWLYHVGPHGLSGAYEDDAFLEYTVCPEVPAHLVDRVDAAFGAYTRSAVEMVPQTGTSCVTVNPTPNPNDDPTKPSFDGWFLDVMPDGERVLDGVHGVRFASSDTSPSYYYVGALPESKGLPAAPGFALTAHVEHVLGDPYFVPLGPNASWELFINGVDFSYNDATPSEVAWAWGGQSRHLTDVVMHEAGHVLGMGHTGVSKALYPTVIQTSAAYFPYAHLGLEVGSELYDPDLGPLPGTYEVPVIDFLFLEDHYGLYLLGDDPYMYAFEGVQITDAHHPVGWEANETTYMYSAPFELYHVGSVNEPPCAESGASVPLALSATNLSEIESILPRFTSRAPITLDVTFGTLSAGPTAGWAVLDGTATIVVSDDGTYSDPPSLPSLTVVDAWVDGNIHHDVVLTATFADAATGQVLHQEVPLNAYLTLFGCDET